MKQFLFPFRSQAAEAQLLPTLLALTANQGRCSAGTGTCFGSPHAGAPFQGVRMKGCLHPEPSGPAGNMPCRPTFLSDTSGWETCWMGVIRR